MITLIYNQYGTLTNSDTSDTIVKNSHMANDVFISVPDLLTSLAVATQDYICTLTFQTNDGSTIGMEDLATTPTNIVFKNKTYYGYKYSIPKSITRISGDLKMTARLIRKRDGIQICVVNQNLYVADNSTPNEIATNITETQYTSLLESISKLNQPIEILEEGLDEQTDRVVSIYLCTFNKTGIFVKKNGKSMYFAQKHTDNGKLVLSVGKYILLYRALDGNATLEMKSNDFESLHDTIANLGFKNLSEMLNSLETNKSELDKANTFTASNTFNGSTTLNGDTKVSKSKNSVSTTDKMLISDGTTNTIANVPATKILEFIKNEIANATTTSKGFMSAEDKSQLSNLENVVEQNKMVVNETKRLVNEVLATPKSKLDGVILSETIKNLKDENRDPLFDYNIIKDERGIVFDFDEEIGIMIQNKDYNKKQNVRYKKAWGTKKVNRMPLRKKLKELYYLSDGSGAGIIGEVNGKTYAFISFETLLSQLVDLLVHKDSGYQPTKIQKLWLDDNPILRWEVTELNKIFPELHEMSSQSDIQRNIYFKTEFYDIPQNDEDPDFYHDKVVYDDDFPFLSEDLYFYYHGPFNFRDSFGNLNCVSLPNKRVMIKFVNNCKTHLKEGYWQGDINDYWLEIQIGWLFYQVEKKKYTFYRVIPHKF